MKTLNLGYEGLENRQLLAVISALSPTDSDFCFLDLDNDGNPDSNVALHKLACLTQLVIEAEAACITSKSNFQLAQVDFETAEQTLQNHLITWIGNPLASPVVLGASQIHADFCNTVSLLESNLKVESAKTPQDVAKINSLQQQLGDATLGKIKDLNDAKVALEKAEQDYNSYLMGDYSTKKNVSENAQLSTYGPNGACTLKDQAVSDLKQYQEDLELQKNPAHNFDITTIVAMDAAAAEYQNSPSKATGIAIKLLQHASSGNTLTAEQQDFVNDMRAQLNIII